MTFDSQKEILEYINEGGWVQHIYTGVAFYMSNGKNESGITKNPNAEFLGFFNYEKYLKE